MSIPASPDLRDHPPSRTNSTNPRVSLLGTLRRRASVNGLSLTSEVNAVAALSPSGTNQSPTLGQRGSSFPGPGVIDIQPAEESALETLTHSRRIQVLFSSHTVPPTLSATDGTLHLVLLVSDKVAGGTKSLKENVTEGRKRKRCEDEDSMGA
jgi:hypothetical protein